MSKLSESIVGQIKERAIKPVSRPWFLLKYGIIWLLAGLAVIGSGIFFGSLIAELQHADWRLASRWPGGRIGYLREAVSALWVIGTLIMVTAGAVFLRQTRHGYRYGGLALLILLFLGSGALALVTLLTPVPPAMRVMHERVSPPRLNAGRFHDPAAGRLLGEIIAVDRDTATLQAVDGAIWELWLFDGQTIPAKTLTQVYGEVLFDDVFAVLSVRPVPPGNFVQELPPTRRMPR